MGLAIRRRARDAEQTMERTDRLFVSCRFTVRIWELIYPRQWNGLNIKEWWSMLAEGATPYRKALASLTLLTMWKIWIERNARVFHNMQSSSFVIVDKIK
jgi:hypothetical protein